jgi:exosome complex RNA-binding protein Csl4
MTGTELAAVTGPTTGVITAETVRGGEVLSREPQMIYAEGCA